MKAEARIGKVVIRDGPPPTVVCRDAVEQHAAEAIVQIIRRGGEPIATIYRKADGAIEVSARSVAFSSVAHAVEVMKEATVKLTASLFRKIGHL